MENASLSFLAYRIQNFFLLYAKEIYENDTQKLDKLKKDMDFCLDVIFETTKFYQI